MKVGRVTCSDRASAGIYQDAGGPEIERVFSGVWPEPVVFVARVIPDDISGIEAALKELADDVGCPLIITTGGTGFAKRDVTPEATLAVIEKELPGFGEIMRSLSFTLAPTSILFPLDGQASGAVRSSLIYREIRGLIIAQCLHRRCCPPFSRGLAVICGGIINPMFENHGCRCFKNFTRRTGTQTFSVAQDEDLVAEGGDFVGGVGDVEHGDFELVAETLEVGDDFPFEIVVEAGEGFVQ